MEFIQGRPAKIIDPEGNETTHTVVAVAGMLVATMYKDDETPSLFSLKTLRPMDKAFEGWRIESMESEDE